ncbi:oligosaccharide flippase family protein [Gammaproteobacteria bacterium]|nr:oligosaccharide flippase family protein [Gammaproteobacteria bacterium]
MLFSSFGWSFLAELISKSVTPVVFLTLTYLLGPESFGIMALAVMVVSFSQIFVEGGLGRALIHWAGNLEHGANTVFLCNLLVAFTVVIILNLVAPYLANIVFGDPRLVDVIRVISVAVFASGFTNVHLHLMQKQMNFKRVFAVRLGATVVPGIISVPIAYLGGDYWGLVYGYVLGQIVQGVLAVSLSGWSPQWYIHPETLRRLWKFGVWCIVTSLLGWLVVWSDSLILGIKLSARELGIYNVGQQSASIFFAVIISPAMPVLYSYFSMQSESKVYLRNNISQIIIITAWIALPFGVFTYIFADIVVEFLFSDKWLGLAGILSFLVLRQAFASITAICGEAYRSIGKPSYETMMLFIAVCIGIPIYIFAVNDGLQSLALSKFYFVLFTLFLHLLLLKRVFKLNFFQLVKNLIFIFALSYMVATGLSYVLDKFDPRILTKLASLVVVYLIFMVTMVKLNASLSPIRNQITKLLFR